jgi:hypothetical protein
MKMVPGPISGEGGVDWVSAMDVSNILKKQSVFSKFR